MECFGQKVGPQTLATLVFLSAAAVAPAQFNIDLNNDGYPPELGGGVPHASFGAAANQSGIWNDLNDAGNSTQRLYDLAGNLTNVTCTGPSGGIGFGYNFAGNTGDYALLLNDTHQSSHDVWTFAGMANGSYEIYTYAVAPNSPDLRRTAITVSGSVTPNPQIVTGPMPGNQFILGVTHSVHDIIVSDNSFSITVDWDGTHVAHVNGFQIVPVPEPASLSVLALGAIALLRRKR